MRRWSGRRGQVEPLAAIVAVATVGVAIGLYAGALDGVVDPDDERDTDAIAIDRVLDRAEAIGVLEPERLEGALGALPPGLRANATLSVDGRTIAVGSAPPDGETTTASRRIAVRTAPGVVRPGRLSITVWR